MQTSADDQTEIDAWHMRRALELAVRGQGRVEPNPMVGCVIARGAEIIGEGYHKQFGGPHAEIEALAVAGKRASGATAYVTLEPCCHQGKTPPCTDALLAAGVARVVYAMDDPFPKVAGGGAARLRAAGLIVECGLHADLARSLNAPYLKLIEKGRPWMIAKWAMTLDGKLATRTGDSKWISGEASRAVVQQLRARCDAIMIGAGTARADDPQLTVRVAAAAAAVRTPLRIIADDGATLSPTGKLATTARDVPVLVAVSSSADSRNVDVLRSTGCEVLQLAGTTRGERLGALLDELGRRRLTNVLVEGGGTLLGELFDLGEIDEVHVFIAPKLIGGATAFSPLAGLGSARMTNAVQLSESRCRTIGDDVYLSGRIAR